MSISAKADQQTVPILADQGEYLIATAARAPSVRNTQPWRFRVGDDAIELYAGQTASCGVDPAGRYSSPAAPPSSGCASRSGHWVTGRWSSCSPTGPSCDCSPARPGAAEPMTAMQRQLLAALPHRHTTVARSPLPPG
jgi:nitroreductase